MQFSIFDMGCQELRITKPIRLIELFGGYGSQALALKYLGVDFEHWKLCEWAVKSIQAYKDMHYPNDNTDYSQSMNFEEIIDFLFDKGISADYNKPMTREQIKRMGESKCRTVYNNIIATKNLVSITNIKGGQLDVVDTDEYTYIMTYSFPCQDLSNAGLKKGMAKGEGTRSGLLWEVERILDECENKPQILLMENVPEVIGANNLQDFNEWLNFLQSLGYRNYYKLLNAKHYGIPQNRERCFMVSILDNCYYDFPQPIPLEKRLKDILENEVDENYYLNEKMLKYIVADNEKWQGNNKQSIINREIAVTVNTRCGCTRSDCSDYICKELPDNYNLKDEIKCVAGIGEKSSNNNTQWYMQHRIYDAKIALSVTTAFNPWYLLGKIRKLTPKEAFRLQGVKDSDFERVAKNQSNASLYHICGDSIVCDVLMAIFGEMLGIDWKSKTKEKRDSI